MMIPLPNQTDIQSEDFEFHSDLIYLNIQLVDLRLLLLCLKYWVKKSLSHPIHSNLNESRKFPNITATMCGIELPIIAHNLHVYK